MKSKKEFYQTEQLTPLKVELVSRRQGGRAADLRR
jgi:hypothetical protein